MINKTTDRMPKEYKIALYAILIGTTYFLLYSLIFYGKFKYLPFFLLSLGVVALFGVPAMFLLKKSNWARVFLGIVSIIFSALFIVIAIALIFFKQSTAFLAKSLHTGIFTFYFLLGQVGTTPDKGVVAAILISLWNALVAYLLFHKETRKYTIEKTYPEVDTRKETTISIIILFLVIAFLYVLVRF
jgi:amino acid transporter